MGFAGGFEESSAGADSVTSAAEQQVEPAANRKDTSKHATTDENLMMRASVLRAADVAADPREMIPRPSDGRRSHCTLYLHYTCGVDFVKRELRKFVKIF